MKKIILFCLSLIFSISNAQTNLIKNGSFETETENWHGDIGTISPYDFKVGKNSLTINQFVGKEWKGIDQIAIIPKNTYAIECSVWIKTDAIEGGKEVYNAGVMTAEFTSSSDKNISYENIAQVQGTTNWILYKKIVLVPTDAKKIRIMLALAQTNGSIFYDDVKVITLSGEEYNKIMQANASPIKVETTAENLTFNNGNFEAELKNWSGSGTISTTDKKEGNSCATINSTVNQWTAIDQTAAIPEGTKTIEISGWLKAKNIKQGTETWNNGMFIIEFTSDGKTKTTNDQLIGTVTETTDWEFFQKKINIPVGTKKYRIMLALSACTGTLLADDIQVRMLQE